MDFEMETMEGENDVIKINGVCKKFGSQVILNGLHMNVPEGCIYALLGSSGCGKTTILKCIMGITKIDCGEIHMKDSISLGKVGWMPQEIALIDTLSIKETFSYYGKIFGLSDDVISQRSYDFANIFQLPDLYSTVSSISGGQQRRVSLAISLLHNPKLIILDEPTVGLDPLLSEIIWDYFMKVTSQLGRTIILTTHYIEEARRAHVVGMMRGGKLLAEAPPLQLMENYNCATLEEVFLILSDRDSRDEPSGSLGTDLMSVPTPNSAGSLINAPTGLQSTKSQFSYNRFRAQLYKNYLFVLRDVASLFMFTTVPLVPCLLLNLLEAKDMHGFQLAVVNEDANNCTTIIPSNLCDLNYPVSCQFLQHIQRTYGPIDLIYKEDTADGLDAVRKKEAWGFIYFSQNFSELFLDRITFGIMGIDEDTLDIGTIQIRLDMTDFMLSALIRRELFDLYSKFVENLIDKCHLPGRIAESLIKNEEPVHNTKNNSYVKTQVPINILTVIFHHTMLSSLAILLPDKLSGSLNRVTTLGLTYTELILALAVMVMGLYLIETVMMYLIVYVLFDNPFVIGNLLLSLCLFTIQGFNGMLLGLITCVFCNLYTTALLSSVGIFFFMSTASGLLWPIQGSYYLIKDALWLSPFALPAEAFRGVTIKGWPFLHPVIFSGFISLTVWSIIFTTLLVAVVKIKGFNIVTT